MKEKKALFEFKLSPELFERSAARVFRRRSPLFKFKLKVFCMLHRPVNCYSRAYHYFITGLILYSCVVVNVFDSVFTSYSVVSMAVTDLFLAGILTGELILRFWSCDCKSEFSGFCGRLLYLKRYSLLRALDLMAIITFATFVYLQRFTGILGIFIRLLHVLQVCQIYRLILPLLKLMISTIMVQFHQLLIAFIFTTLILMLMSFSLYLKEMGRKDKVFTIFDSFWLSFITLTTIGYGDESAQTMWGKTLTVFLAFAGIVLFQLPANIFGTGLAIKLKDEQQKLRLQNPAANLIQTFFRCYATDKESKQRSVWKLFKKSRPLTEMDKQCIRFILKFRYLRARRQFKTVTDPKKFDEDSDLQLELLRKVSLIENNILDCKDRTYELRSDFDSISAELQQILTDLEMISKS